MAELEYYERYGHNANPFALRRLNPLREQADQEGFLRDIDGFQKLNAVEKYLTDRVGSFNAPADRPAFVLITGNDKSGLSSAAYEVLFRYRKLLSQDIRLIFVEAVAKDHSSVALYNNWAAGLGPELRRLLPKLNLQDEVATLLASAKKLSDPNTLAFDLKEAIVGLLPAFKMKPMTVFSSCIEKIKTAEAIEICRTVFEDFPAICVFTAPVGAFNVEDFKTQNPDVHVLSLGHLTSEEVKRVLEKKWGSPNLPFHVPTMGSFCENRKHTVGAVLKLAEGVLKRRVRAYEGVKGIEAGFWPNDVELSLTPISTRELMEETVLNAD